MTETFKVGDQVVITDGGQSFTTYTSWADKNGLQNLHYGVRPAKDDNCIIIKIAQHSNERSYKEHYGDLLGIRNKDGNEYIVCQKGVKLQSTNGFNSQGVPTNFTADDVKPSMKVRTAQGNTGFVVAHNNNKFVLYYGSGSFDAILFQDAEDPRGRSVSGNNDIVEVYDVSNLYDLKQANPLGKLLWSRTDMYKSNEEKRLELQEAIITAEQQLDAAYEALRQFENI